MPNRLVEAGNRAGTRTGEWVVRSPRNAVKFFIAIHGLLIGLAWLFAWLLTSPDNWDADHTPVLHHAWFTVFWWALAIEIAWVYAPFIGAFIKALWKVWRGNE